jgi:hypothetical protein
MLRRFLLLIISAVSAAITAACGHRPVDDPLFSKISMQALVNKSSQGRLECPITSAGGQLIRFRPEDKGFAVDYVDGQHQGHIRISGKLMSQDWYSLQMVMEQS